MNLVIDKALIHKFDVQGPRYTSYPTAPQWSNTIQAPQYIDHLRAYGKNDKTLSLYIHIPFCEQLCYFCACNKVIRANEEKVGDEYLEALFIEMRLVAQAIGARKTVKQLHWGGGTPTYLSSDQSSRLFTEICKYFDVDTAGEIAIEIDPRTVTLDKLTHLKKLGFNRVSMGVQDFDPKVQDDINRIQPFEQVAAINAHCRALQFDSVNFDLIYGLPYQTRATFQKTVEQVIDLRPDRIALYSFAYVPWLSKPQNKFNLEAIAQHDEKLDIFINSRNQLISSGYKAIAMDHFALGTDDMAKAFEAGNLHRNFMGYTLKPADEFIGLGLSSIGYLDGTYVQNVKVLPDYYAHIAKGQLPVERGHALTRDDQARRFVINKLMCAFEINTQDFLKATGLTFDEYFAAEAEHLAQCVEDGLLIKTLTGYQATELGKIFIRNVCMGFDFYLRQKGGHKRFSRTV